MGEFLKLLKGDTSSISDVKLNPFDKLGPPEQGTLRNFLNRMGMQPQVSGVPLSEEPIPKSEPPVAQRGVLREENIPLPQPRPRNLGMQSMTPEVLKQAQDAIGRGAGLTFEERMKAAQDAISSGMFDPQGANYTDMKKNGQKPIGIPKGTRFADSDFSSKGKSNGKKIQPLHPLGTFFDNTRMGDVVNGLADDLGVTPPKNIIPFPPRKN